MRDLQPQLLERAIAIVGGPEQLAKHLDVSTVRLKLWLAGSVRLPDPVFLKAVDLVLQDDIARAEQDRRQRLRQAPSLSHPGPVARISRTD